MKIGILTFHDTNNFGSIAQTYGLYKKIVDLGFDCEVIDYQCANIVRREIPKPFHLSLSPKSILHDVFNERHQRMKYNSLSGFLHEKMALSPLCDRHNIIDVTEDYDTLLIGSDIVWGLDITANDLTYFLDFASNRTCHKISYAASIGNPWNDEQKTLVAPLLNKFDHITVREDESALWVKDASGCDSRVVCDPSMLLTTSEWQKEINNQFSFKDKYILVYFNKGKCLQTAIQYSKKTGLKVKLVGYGVSRSKDYSFVQPHSFGDFLSLIFNAEIVFTASYHGFLFSTYFSRPFVYFNISHPSRMTTLAKRLGVNHLDATQGMPDCISYDVVTVHNNIEAFRLQSIDTLKAMLES